MATLEQLVVELTAETSKLRVDLTNAAKVTAKATDSIAKSVEEMSKNSNNNISTFQTAIGTMAGFVGGNIVTGAFQRLQGVASSLFDFLIVDGVKAAQEQEAAVNKLNIQLALTGQYTKEVSDRFATFAEQIQLTTKYTSEEALGAATLIQALGRLKSDGLERATQASINLAAALSIDLRSAASLVGKAATGEVSAFKKYGITIEETGTKAQILERTLTTLEKRFGGTGTSQIKTYEGLQLLLIRNFNSISGTIGEVLTKNQALLSAMSKLSDIFVETNQSVKDSQQGLRVLAGEVIVSVINQTGELVDAMDRVGRVFEFTLGVMKAIVLPLTSIVGLFISLKDGAEGLTFMNDVIKDIGDNLTAFGADHETTLSKVKMRFAEVGVAAENGLALVKAGVDSTIEPMNSAQEKVRELTAEEQKRLDLLKQFADTYYNNSLSLDDAYSTELDLLKTNLEEKLITEDEYQQARLDALAQKQLDEQQQLRDALASKQITEEQYAKAKKNLDAKQDIAARKAILDRKKYEEEINKQKLQGYSQFFGGLGALANSSSKELAAIGKAGAIAKATIDAYVAIQNALANVPYPANYAAAAGIGVQAFANVSKIAGVKLNRGGEVPGPRGANKDSVPAMLTTGETVIDRDTTDKLKQFLSGQGNASPVKIEITLRDELVEFIEARIIERQNLGTSLLTTKVI